MTRLNIHQPAKYIIVVGTHLEFAPRRASQTLRCRFVYSADGVPLTVMEGVLSDQGALHNILTQIRDYGVPLYKVDYEPADEADDSCVKSETVMR